MPVLLTLLGLRPRGGRRRHGAERGGVAARRRAVRAACGIAADRARRAGAAHDPARTGAAIREALPDPGWSLGYSGGSPTMAATAFQCGTQRTGQPLPDVSSDPAAWYVAESGDALLRHDGVYVESATVLAGSNVSLVELMRLHGAEPLGDLQRWQPHVPARDVDAVLNGLVRLPGGSRSTTARRRSAPAPTCCSTDSRTSPTRVAPASTSSARSTSHGGDSGSRQPLRPTRRWSTAWGSASCGWPCTPGAARGKPQGRTGT